MLLVLTFINAMVVVSHILKIVRVVLASYYQ